MKRKINLLLLLMFIASAQSIFTSPKIDVEASVANVNTQTLEGIDKTKCIDMLHQYAPLIWYSSLETIYPSSMEEMHECAKIVDNTVKYTKSWNKLRGDFSRAKNYAFFYQENENTMRLVYLQYYMIDPGKFMILSHYGDWEGCRIIFNKEDGEWVPTTLSFNHHGITTKVDWDSSEISKDGDHPIIYASRGSHGIYLTSGIHQYRTCLFDSTNKGKSWSTWDHLESYYYDNGSKYGFVSLEGNDHTFEFSTITAWGQSYNSPTGPVIEKKL